MGRGKVVLRRIEDKKGRNVTFSKRRQGLFKKARELSALCGADVAVLVTSFTRRSYLDSHPASVEDIVQRYHKHKLAHPTKEGSEHQLDNMHTIQRFFINLNSKNENLNVSELHELETQLYEILKEVIHWKNLMIDMSNSSLHEKVEANPLSAEKEIMNELPLAAPLLEQI